MLPFEGKRELNVSAEAAWSKLSDVAFLVSCIPDSHVQEIGDHNAKFKVTPGFSFVRGSLDVEMERLASEDTMRLDYLFRSKGVGSSSEVVTSLHIEPAESGSTVSWKAEIRNLTGLLKLAPTGLMRGAAQKVISDVWDRVVAEL